MRTFISSYRLAIIVTVLMMILGMLAGHIQRADKAFTHAYLEYAAASDDADTAIYTPTATNNPVRQGIQTSLIQVLGGSLRQAERYEKAKKGVELTKQAQEQIDAMSPTLERAADAIALMQESVRPFDSLFQRGDPQRIIALAQKRLTASKDIQALSYKANFDTTKIFAHLVETKGELSNAYIAELNTTIAAEEEGYNARQERYQLLSRTYDEIRERYADFTSIFDKSER